MCRNWRGLSIVDVLFLCISFKAFGVGQLFEQSRTEGTSIKETIHVDTFYEVCTTTAKHKEFEDIASPGTENKLLS